MSGSSGAQTTGRAFEFACPVCGEQCSLGSLVLDSVYPEWVDATTLGDRVDGREVHLMSGLRATVSGWSAHSCTRRTTDTSAL